MSGQATVREPGRTCHCRTSGQGNDRPGVVPRTFPGEIYHELTREFGEPIYDRIEAPLSLAQKDRLATLSSEQIRSTELAGEKIETILTHAPGNGAPIGGLKVVTANGWFAARPSGTENIYKIYVESFRDQAHLRRIAEEAQTIVQDAIEK